MNEIVKRIAPSKDTLVRLFTKSGNNCAFENCTEKLFDERGTFIAEVCHIEAAMPGGERFNKTMTNAERAKEDNLILFCHKHHKQTDNVNDYPVKKLQEIKQKHEMQFLTANETVTEKNVETFLERFEELMTDKLKSIKNFLLQIRTFQETEKYFDKPKGRLDPSKDLFENNLIYFTSDEAAKISNVRNSLLANEEQFALITGHPSVGKTIVALVLSEQLKQREFKSYYFSFSSQHNLRDIKEDIDKLRNFKTLIVFDDVHKNLPLVVEVFDYLFSFQNISSILVSRDLSDELQEVGESAFSIYGTVKLKLTLSQKSHQEKFVGVINAFKNNFQIHQRTGDILKVLNFCHFNLLKLKLLLEAWRDAEFEKPLSEINEGDFNNSLKKRYLTFNQRPDEDELKRYCSVYSYGIDFHFIQNNETKEALEYNGIVTKSSGDLQLYQFWHSKFAELLLLCILESEPRTDRRNLINNIAEVRANQLTKYLKFFPSGNIEEFQYPLNMLEIISSLSQQKEKIVLQKILREHFNLVAEYINNENPSPIELKELLKHLRFNSSTHFETIIERYIATQEFIDKLLNNEFGYDVFSYILLSCYKLNLSKTAAKITTLISNKTLRRLIKNAPLNSLTLSTRIFKNYYPELSVEILNSITIDDWAKKLKTFPAFIISNSLTEIKSSDHQLAYKILSVLDNSVLQSKAKELKFYYFEKFISELKEIDFQKAYELLDLYDEHRMLKALEKCEASQMGKGLVSLFKINPRKISSTYSKVGSEETIERLQRIPVSDACRIVSELSIVSKEKTKEIFAAYLKNLSIEKVKNVVDYLNLVHTILNLKFEPKAVLVKFTKHILLPWFTSSTPNNYAAGLAAINEYNPSLAREIYSATHIDLENVNVKFSSYGNILLKLKKVDAKRSIQLFKSINKNTILKKALANDINFNQIIKAIDELKNLDASHTENILNLITRQQKFKDKVFRLPFDQLLHSISAIHKLDKELANHLFEVYRQKHGQSILNQKINFLSLAQGLSRVSEFDRPRAQKILESFTRKLKLLLPLLQLHELTTGLSEIANFSKNKAKELLDSCSTNQLIEKARRVKRKSLPGVLGEIKKYDLKKYNEINTYLKAATPLN
jgi:hypothetical protein